MKKGKPANKAQVNQYDKILQENIEAALPGIVKDVLHIRAVRQEELPDSLQHTKERKPDLLKKVTDDTGAIFVLHIEFQTTNDPEMAYRMAEYWVMLLRKYKLPVKQYVIYLGEGVATMPASIAEGECYYCYNMVSLSLIDYNIFLRSGKPEERIFAVLGNFGADSAETAIAKIVAGITKTVGSNLEKERLKNQLRILAQLRNLAAGKIDIMQSVSTFFKEENDLFYIAGEIHGIEKGKAISVKNLLRANKFAIDEIAAFAGVTEEFVIKIKKELES